MSSVIRPSPPAVVIAGLIVWSALVLLCESGSIFCQQSPVDPADVRAAVESIDSVERA